MKTDLLLKPHRKATSASRLQTITETFSADVPNARDFNHPALCKTEARQTKTFWTSGGGLLLAFLAFAIGCWVGHRAGYVAVKIEALNQVQNL